MCAEKLLFKLLHKKQSPVTSWAPSLQEICRLFLNYGQCRYFFTEVSESDFKLSQMWLCHQLPVHLITGATTDSLFVENDIELREGIGFARQLEGSILVQNGVEDRHTTFGLENLKFVLQVFTWAFQQRYTCASVENVEQ